MIFKLEIFKSYILAKKEVKHSLIDFRVMLTIVISTLVFYPGLMIGVTYFQEKSLDAAQSNIPTIALEKNDARFIRENFQTIPFIIYEGDRKKEVLLDDEIEGIMNLARNGSKIKVSYQYKANSPKSLASYEKVKAWFSLIEKNQLNDFINSLENIDTTSLYDFKFQSTDVTPESQRSQLVSIIPYIILIGVIAGIMGIGVDNTAGEKERNTLVTLLTSSQSSSEIALGKVLSTSFFGIITSLLTITGFIVGSLISANMLDMENLINIDIVNFFLLLTILFPISLFFSNIILILGIFSKNVKEANSYIMPLYIVIIFVGFISTMMEKGTDLKLALIPVVNSVLSIKSILINEISTSFISISILSTIFYTILLMMIFIQLFKKEKYTLG